MLRGLSWFLITDVSGQYIGPILNSQTVQEDFFDCLTLEEYADMLSRNVGDQIPTYAASKGLNLSP
jgi:hypothetical protein